MDTVTAEIPASENVGAAIQLARHEIRGSIVEAGLTRDPLRLVLGALEVTLGSLYILYAAHVEQSQKAAGDLDTHARAIKSLSLDPNTVDQLVNGAVRGADKRAVQLARAHNWRTLAIATMAGMGLITLSAAGGFWWGWGSAITRFDSIHPAMSELMDKDPTAATNWTQIMRLNSIPTLLANCTGNAINMQEGRRVCDLPVWLDPPMKNPPGTR